MSGIDPAHPREPLLEIDRRISDVCRPYRHSLPIRSVGFCGQIGDQAPMRVLSGSLVALALLRRDPQLLTAGVRMLAAHELATFAKNRIKHRIDRRRPRSTGGEDEHIPHKGKRRDKETTSFPSGHSAGAMAGACAAAAVYPEHRTALLSAGVAVGAAQVSTSAHYPSDVAAGLAIGTAANSAVGLAFLLASRLVRRLLA